MNNSIIGAMLLILIVIIQGVASWKEKTFYRKQSSDNIKLPFILHGGVVIGDLILIPSAVYIWTDYLKYGYISIYVILMAAILATWFFHHWCWFEYKNHPVYMFPNQRKSVGNPRYWYRDLPLSAWLHFIYMAAAIVYIGGYIISPMPEVIVRKTFWIFIVFVPIAIIEPRIVESWPPTKKYIINTIIIAIVLWAFVGLVTWMKLNHNL